MNDVTSPAESVRAPLEHLRLVALNIDGVVLNDTFSPVIHAFITSRGGRYDAEVERSIFSRRRAEAGLALGRAAGLDLDSAEVLSLYFEERAAYLARNPIRILPGAEALLLRLRGLGVATVCYGGLDKEHFDTHVGPIAHLFDGPGYVCTNEFRPGVREVTEEVFGLAPEQALFVDDVAKVGEVAAALGVNFIGHPSPFAHGHQGELMRAAGLRHVVDTLDAIDEPLLRILDREAGERAREHTPVL
ncbi:HAD family phosphatase [Streptomyces sp. BI20]|uniref:HAD family phosphatase n=1 Tax=Streptomyces sp. BI20 TaxID=3403460 RepID=UPI003C780481